MKAYLEQTMKGMLTELQKGSVSHVKIVVPIDGPGVVLPDAFKGNPAFTFVLSTGALVHIEDTELGFGVEVNDVTFVCAFPYASISMMLSSLNDVEVFHVINHAANTPTTVIAQAADALASTLKKYDIPPEAVKVIRKNCSKCGKNVFSCSCKIGTAS